MSFLPSEIGFYRGQGNKIIDFSGISLSALPSPAIVVQLSAPFE
jgi:hypothetical protein